MVINVPEWAEIGKFIEYRMYDKNHGKMRWFREKIISYGNDGFFHQDYNCPVYYNRFSDLGKSVRLCEQKYDYNAACGLDNQMNFNFHLGGVNVMRKVVLEPHKEKSNLWCWNVLQYSESQDTWYSIGSGIEVNWDIAARKAKEIIKM